MLVLRACLSMSHVHWRLAAGPSGGSEVGLGRQTLEEALLLSKPSRLGSFVPLALVLDALCFYNENCGHELDVSYRVVSRSFDLWKWSLKPSSQKLVKCPTLYPENCCWKNSSSEYCVALTHFIEQLSEYCMNHPSTSWCGHVVNGRIVVGT